MKFEYPNDKLQDVESVIPNVELNRRAIEILKYLYPKYDIEFNFSQYSNAINAIKSVARIYEQEAHDNEIK